MRRRSARFSSKDMVLPGLGATTWVESPPCASSRGRTVSARPSSARTPPSCPDDVDAGGVNGAPFIVTLPRNHGAPGRARALLREHAGVVGELPDAQSDAYFRSRPLKSRLGALA